MPTTRPGDLSAGTAKSTACPSSTDLPLYYSIDYRHSLLREGLGRSVAPKTIEFPFLLGCSLPAFPEASQSLPEEAYTMVQRTMPLQKRMFDNPQTVEYGRMNESTRAIPSVQNLVTTTCHGRCKAMRCDAFVHLRGQSTIPLYIVASFIILNELFQIEKKECRRYAIVLPSLIIGME